MHYKNVTWNTGSAAERFRLKNKKKPKATSAKPQAPSATKKTQLNSTIKLERL